MPAAFVHGNPETAAIWEELFEHLDRDDVVALSPPGFGAPASNDFPATSDAYLGWLIDAVAAMIGAPIEDRVAQFESLGMGRPVAHSVASANDATMARCILALYRSAAQPAMANWGNALGDARARPGLVIIPTEDHYTGGETLARRSAERAGAEVAILRGLGHWWMCEDPARGAAVLNAFFASVA